MGQAIGFIVLNELNIMLNRLSPKEAVEPAERYLDNLVRLQVLTSWERIPERKGGGWAIFTEDNPDGVYISWNDKEKPFVGPGHVQTPKNRSISYDKRWKEGEDE